MQNHLSISNLSLTNSTTKDYIITLPNIILSSIINCILLITIIWILVSLVSYGIKNGKWKKMQRGNSEKLNATIVYSSVTVCAGLCTLRLIASEIKIVTLFDARDGILCNFFYDLTDILLIFVFISVHLFFWVRQRVFYKNCMLNRNYSKWIRYLSKFTIIPPIIAASVSAIAYITINTSNVTIVGCVHFT